MGHPGDSRPGTANLDTVLISDELVRRAPRRPDFEAENRALVALAREMADAPHNILQKLAETALDLCTADTAGISLLEASEGGEVFRWHGLAGVYANYRFDTIPRHDSPCGVVIDRGSFQLLSHPGRYFPRVADMVPPVTEVLLIPFYLGGKPIGTIWVVAHGDGRKFDAEDLRVMTSLGSFASTALHVLSALEATSRDRDELGAHVRQRTADLRQANLALQEQIAERQRSEQKLREAEAKLMALFHAGVIGIVWGEGQLITEANDVFLRMLDYTREDLPLNWGEMTPSAIRRESEQRVEEAIRTGKFAPFEKEFIRKDGGRVPVLVGGYCLGTDPFRYVGFILDITAQKRAGDLKLRQERLRAHAAAQEEERRRIARELHDQTGQQLTAFILGLKALRDSPHVLPPATDALKRIQEMAEGLGRELHEIATRLRPTALEDLGLGATVRNYLEEWSQRYGVEADFQVSGPDEHRLPPLVETAAYRIVQEALTNVAKHAGAGRVSVVLGYQKDRLVAIVEDDGRGFEADEVAGSPAGQRRLGLIGMEERVAQVGGTLEIESRPGGGTSVIAVIPLPDDGGGADG